MIKTAKICLKPTPEQEVLFWKSAGVARWAYNYFLSENDKIYKEYLGKDKTGKKSISEGEIRKYINNTLKPTTHAWLGEVGSNVMKQAVKDADNAMKRFFKGLSGYPKFKSKHKSRPSFYVNYESLIRKPNGFHGEKIGFVKTSESLPKIPKDAKYINPHISYDGKYWYLTVGYEIETSSEDLTDVSLGIDLGIKELAVCSNGKTYKNINKTKEVKRLKKKLKREQRKLSRKTEANIKGYTENHKPIYNKSLSECQNFQKQKVTIKLLNRKLKNIRNNHIHQTTADIVKTKPYRVVMENLNVQGMMKNRHLSKATAEQGFYEFIRQMKYKCEFNGIEFIQADRFYPSSKICSCCGCVKSNLKLSDRVYVCPDCGFTIDRDLNAAINLANY